MYMNFGVDLWELSCTRYFAEAKYTLMVATSPNDKPLGWTKTSQTITLSTPDNIVYRYTTITDKDISNNQGLEMQKTPKEDARKKFIIYNT